MTKLQRRGLLQLVSVLPVAGLAAAASPPAARLGAIQGEALGRAAGSALPGILLNGVRVPALVAGEPTRPPNPRPEPALFAPPGWDTLENVR